MYLVLTLMIHVLMVAVITGKHFNNRRPDFNPEDFSQLGISTEDFYQHLKHLSDGNINCGMHTLMTRHYIRNKTVTCNDGSPAGYYLRKSSLMSSRWLIYLDGGWFCFDESSCHSRWRNSASLMSSYDWTLSRKGTGILSSDHVENPHMYDVNTVAIPYCSSDVWSGNRQPRTKNDFAFHGALILEEVIKDLVYAHGLAEASIMFLAGSSAGGTGVLVNLDRIAGILAHIAPRVEVRGIVDSGWFLDNKQYENSDCRDVFSCSPTLSIQKGMQLWHGQVPENCKKHYSEKEEWRCYFGYRVYPSLKTPVFVIQHLFDEAQITADNVGSPVKRKQWQYIHDVGHDMRQTLLNVSAVFAPSCWSHILLIRSDWKHVSIRGVTLPQAINCWEAGANEKNLYSRTTQGKYYIELTERLITGQKTGKKVSDRDGKLQADDPKRSNLHRKHKQKRKRPVSKRNKRKKLRERDKQHKKKARVRAKATRRRQKKEKRRLEREEKKKLKRQEKLQASKKLKASRKTGRKSSNKGGVHHQMTVYDYVIESPTGSNLYQHSEHKTSESFYFNPLQPKVKDITKIVKPSSKSPSSGTKNPASKINLSLLGEKAGISSRTKPVPSSGAKSKTKQYPKTRTTPVPSSVKVQSKRDKKKQKSKKKSQKVEKTKSKKTNRRNRRSSLVFDNHDVHHMEYHGNTCNHHRIDHCEWPQCNLSCPKIYNHFTGKEMDFIDLLMQFGVDMSSINMDVSTIQRMDKNLLNHLINT